MQGLSLCRRVAYNAGYVPGHKARQDPVLSWLKCIDSIRLNGPLPTKEGSRAVESLKVLKNITP